MEKGQWFPFKGTRDKGENNNQAAIREIYEETCGVVKLDNIDLKCHYSTKRKHYHIGLVRIQPETIKQFYQNRNYLLNKKTYFDEYNSYLEKSDVKMFALNYIFDHNFHEITMTPIKYFYTQLKMLENKLNERDFTSSPYLNSVPHTQIKYDSISLLRV